jgi:hypothetical protein
VRIRLSTLGVGVGLTLAIAACGSSHHASKAAVTTAPASTTTAQANRPQEARLTLPEGRSSRSYTVIAPSPAQYAYNIALDLPVSAKISVNIRTRYGAVLSVFESSQRGQGCTAHGSRLTCLLRFPLLPAQKAGHWRVVVSKTSRAPALVHIATTFYQPAAAP